MLKLQEIEAALMKMNDAAFQDICDAYLSVAEPECENIHRKGSASGKQKTAKGTPDSYYTVLSGKYVLLEYATLTSKNKLPKKIREDIDKCVDSEKTGLQLKDIEKITYCINSNLDIADHKALNDYAYEKRVRLEIKSLGTLSTGLLSKGNFLAKEMLGIAMDSGQVLPPGAFIKSYERGGYSTPLHNQFIGRETELSDMEASILDSGVTIVTGPPGVGKTKLILGLFSKLKQSSTSKELYCIDNRHMPIGDDLKTYFQADGEYVVLIDDANRQLTNLKPLLALLKDERKGKLHIIITVRDYAIEEIHRHAAPYEPTIVRLQKLTDEKLTLLLQSPDFGIQHYQYIKRILEIADGNARLAIMAAKVAKDKNTLESLQDVTEIYDNYFSTALSPELFSNTNLLKTLGIMCFFYSVNKEDSQVYSSIPTGFGIDRYKFEESLVELENLELIESSSDLMSWKMADQVLGTYFFYFTFFKKNILDFNVVMKHYFNSHYSRFRDTVIPANNTFGYSNVNQKIEPYLNQFWKDNQHNEEIALKFLDQFWLYKQDEALLFVHNKIQSLPVINDPVFTYNEEKVNRNYSDKDKFIGVLSNFFYHSLERTPDAFDLAAQYVNRVPAQYENLVKILKESIIYHREDESSGFYRQHDFLDFLKKDNPNIPDNLRHRLFYDVVPVLMKTSFNITTNTRKRNSIAFYRYELPLTEHTKELRTKIWDQVKVWFSTHRMDSIFFLLHYLKRSPDKVKKIFSFEKPVLFEIINIHLSPTSFMDCYVVQEFITWFRRLKIDGDYRGLEARFMSDTYKTYLSLNTDYLKRKLNYDSNLPFQQQQDLKEKEIRKAFKLRDTEQFLKFYNQLTEIHDALILTGGYGQQSSLDIVLHEAFVLDPNNKENYIHIACTGNETDFVPWRILQELSSDIDAFRSFRQQFDQYNFKAKDFWLSHWFILLPEDQVTAEDGEDYIAMLKESTLLYYLDFGHLKKFSLTMPAFKSQLLETLYAKNAAGSAVRFHDLFEDHLDEFHAEWSLVKKSYLQQQLLKDSFDHQFKIFYKILEKDSGFLGEYICYWSDGRYFSLTEHDGISIAWNHPYADSIMENAMDLLCKVEYYSIRKDICNVLFTKLPDEQKAKAIIFLKRYILKNNSDNKKVDAVFDCVRHNFPEALEEILLSFLEVQPSFEIFSSVGWTITYMFSNGRSSFGEVRAKQYQTVLDILEKITDRPYRFTDHKSFLRERIQSENRYAAHERKRQFFEQEW